MVLRTRLDKLNALVRAIGVKTVFVAFLFALGVPRTLSALEFSFSASFDRTFPDKWEHRLPGTKPVLVSADTAYPGLPLLLHVLFSDYSHNYLYIADLSFSYRVQRSDGTVCMDSSGISAFTGIADADTGALLSSISPEIVFSRKEQPGICSLLVTAEDRITGEKVSRANQVVLATYPSMEPEPFDVISFNVWVHNYCMKPDPARAVAAFSWFMNSEQSDNDRIFWPVFYFFQSLFHDNPALVEELVGTFPHGSARVREYTVLLLRLIGAKRDGRWPIPDAAWKKFDKLKETGYLDPFAVTFKSASVQFLEMGFYYYGRYAMIRFLIDCLGLHTRDGYRAFVERCTKSGVDAATSMTDGAAEQFRSMAGKILSRAYAKHQLIRSYCDYALTYDYLQPDAEQALRAIITY